MLQNLRKKQQGFTIIEVMIVLIIAAVILLIVFLAIPALQRNSRNTQLKNDVAAVLAGITEFQNNNQGRMPTAVATSGTDVTISSSVSGTTSVVVKVQQGNSFTGSTSATMPAATAAQTVSIKIGDKCNATGNGFAGGNTPRSVAAGFNVEGASSLVPQCQES
jgi:prepilin-type N-terminal cleavage/methylation domain-containing protein